MKPSTAALRKALAINPWFAALPTDVQERMVVCSTLLDLQSGAQLFRQGDMPSAWYGLVRGAVRLSTLRDDGKEHIMALMETGNWVGESALAVNQAYLNNATAEGSVQALALPREVFEALLDLPVFARAVVRLVTGRYRLLYGALGDTSLRSTRSRVAQRLVFLSTGDAAVPSQPRQTLRGSQESLAMMLGINRPRPTGEPQWPGPTGLCRP